jgi:hypothetical protein
MRPQNKALQSGDGWRQLIVFALVCNVETYLEEIKDLGGRALGVDFHHRGGEVRPVVNVLENILNTAMVK